MQDSLSSTNASGIEEVVGFFHPSRRPYRFTILIFISLIVLGSYFAYDSIGALAPTLIDALHIDRSTIGNLYTAYSVAAILIVFFGACSTTSWARDAPACSSAPWFCWAPHRSRWLTPLGSSLPDA